MAEAPAEAEALGLSPPASKLSDIFDISEHPHALSRVAKAPSRPPRLYFILYALYCILYSLFYILYTLLKS